LARLAYRCNADGLVSSWVHINVVFAGAGANSAKTLTLADVEIDAGKPSSIPRAFMVVNGAEIYCGLF